MGAIPRISELLRLLASPSYRFKAAAAATLITFQAARSASQETVPTAEKRLRCMPPQYLDKLRASNVANTLPEAETGECTLRGRVKLIAPAGLDTAIAAQLTSVTNRLVAAAEEHADAIGYGQHINGIIWTLVIRKCSVPDASTLDGVVFVSAGMIERLKDESAAWQAALAGIISHELAHNLARHVLENQLNYLWFRWTLLLRFPYHLAKAAVAAGGLPPRDWVDGWHDEEVASLCRQRELEADELAVSILARAGYPPDSLACALPLLGPRPIPDGAASWQEKLRAALAGRVAGQVEKGVGGALPPGGSSSDDCGPNTHPSVEKRVQRMQHLVGRVEVQQLYRRHSWWTRQRLRWQ